MTDVPYTPDAQFISQSLLHERVVQLGSDIEEHYKQAEYAPLLLIGLLKGSFIFLADLMRHITLPHTVDFMIVASYGSGMESPGWVKLGYVPPDTIYRGKHVLVVDDILDSGTTLRRVFDIIKAQEPKSVEACVLLNKNTKAGRLNHPRFTGFCMSQPAFVVGYGMDHAEGYRHLPYITRIDETKPRGISGEPV
ncbi:hypothetical protein LCGC14_0446680 [marine sediment metagenome]|uniref:hypoxanthine phosphoribosyltransferase n=1 Tax=marine sediment metagenome TaxID=412755 RepID=A0A0F9T260_9ZZZZ